MSPAVYVQTNDAAENEVVALSRAEDGALAPLGRYSTGGRGTGEPHLASAGSVVLSHDGQWLLVVNAGSDELSLFAVQPDGLLLADRVGSGGTKPTSVTIRDTLVYVLNNGTPYGFDFASDGSLVVSEAFGGAKGAAAASSYAVSGAGELKVISGSVGDTRSEVCWVVVTNDDRFAYVTNFGDGTVSSYEIAADRSLKLRDPVAGSTGRDEKGLRDEAISADGRYLYAIDADAQKLFAWAVGQDGRGQLTAAGEYGGLPGTVAGLAAS